MSIVLSHESALEFWQKTHHTPDSFSTVKYAGYLLRQDTPPTLPNNSSLLSLKQPLQALTANHHKRRRSRVFINRLWTRALSAGSILDSKEGFYVSSPEFCFLQMASVLPLVKLIELGFELCGSYKTLDKKLTQCPSVTSHTQLQNFVAKNKGAHGIDKARRALRFITNNSASPMETALTMLLCLPYQLGGYGFEMPILNHKIEKHKTQGTTFSNYYLCDLAWPSKKIALEYDSVCHHSDDNLLLKDTVRRVELACLSYTIFSVSKPHVMTDMGTENLAIALSKHMNRRLRPPEPKFTHARFELRKAIVPLNYKCDTFR